MRIFLILTILIFNFAHAEPESAFEEHYKDLEKKIAELKTHGEKITDENKRQLDQSLKQLKLEYEKTQAEAQRAGHDWTTRATSAFGEIKNGFARAIEKLEQK